MKKRLLKFFTGDEKGTNLVEYVLGAFFLITAIAFVIVPFNEAIRIPPVVRVVEQAPPGPPGPPMPPGPPGPPEEPGPPGEPIEIPPLPAHVPIPEGFVPEGGDGGFCY